MAYPIIDEMAGSWISVRGRLQQSDDPAVAGLFLPSDSIMYYEVIRVVRGIPLFFEDHMERLKNSVHGTLPVPVPDALAAECRQLIAANKIFNVNLRLVLTAGLWVLHLMPSYYPSKEMMEQGVPTGLLAWERENPNTKIIHSGYKAAVADRFAHPGPYGRYFELLLADQKGYLTEGSRSNLFFVKAGRIISAPDSRILKGITRQYIKQAIAAAGSSLSDGLFTFEEIRRGACEAAFLTGSPIDLLPVSSIEDHLLHSAEHPLVKKISACYQQIVDQYILKHTAK